MALKKTVEQMKKLLLEISHDLEKSDRGNRAASQRVRTNTIKFGKVSKEYRKESVAEGSKGTKKKATKRKTTAKKTAKRKVVAKKKAPAKKKTVARKKTTARRKTTAVRRKRR